MSCLCQSSKKFHTSINVMSMAICNIDVIFLTRTQISLFFYLLILKILRLKYENKIIRLDEIYIYIILSIDGDRFIIFMNRRMFKFQKNNLKMNEY